MTKPQHKLFVFAIIVFKAWQFANLIEHNNLTIFNKFLSIFWNSTNQTKLKYAKSETKREQNNNWWSRRFQQINSNIDLDSFVKKVNMKSHSQRVEKEITSLTKDTLVKFVALFKYNRTKKTKPTNRQTQTEYATKQIWHRQNSYRIWATINMNTTMTKHKKNSTKQQKCTKLVDTSILGGGGQRFQSLNRMEEMNKIKTETVNLWNAQRVWPKANKQKWSTKWWLCLEK